MIESDILIHEITWKKTLENVIPVGFVAFAIMLNVVPSFLGGKKKQETNAKSGLKKLLVIILLVILAAVVCVVVATVLGSGKFSHLFHFELCLYGYVKGFVQI